MAIKISSPSETGIACIFSPGVICLSALFCCRCFDHENINLGKNFSSVVQLLGFVAGCGRASPGWVLGAPRALRSAVFSLVFTPWPRRVLLGAGVRCDLTEGGHLVFEHRYQ